MRSATTRTPTSHPIGKDPMPRRVMRRVIVATVLAVAMLFTAAASAQGAAPAWRLIAVTGPTNLAPFSSERQTVTLSGTTGAFTLTFEGETTPSLPLDAPASGSGSVEAALNALPSIGVGDRSVSVIDNRDAAVGTRAYIVTFDGGAFAGSDVPPLTASASGGVSATVTPTPSGLIAINPTNVGGAATDGSPISVEVDLPPGLTATGTGECPVAGQEVICTRALTLLPGKTMASFLIPLVVGPTASANSTAQLSLQGGGVSSSLEYEMPIVVSSVPASAGVQAFWAGAFDADGNPFTQAGGHPHSAGTGFRVNTIAAPTGKIVPAGDPKDVEVNLPPGFIGNPLVTNRCPQDFLGGCGSQADLGQLDPALQSFDGAITDGGRVPVFNDEPARGYAAEFTFKLFEAKSNILGSLRSDSDFGVTATAANIPTVYKVYGAFTVFDGSPIAAAGKAFLTNPTECTGNTLPTLIGANTWQAPGVFSAPVSDESPPVTGCGLVPFDPSMSVTPTSSAPDSASGVEAVIDVPQEDLIDPEAIATSHLKKTVVRLPEGFSVNPSAATGLQGCADAQIGFGSKAEPVCPDGSKIGSVEATSPLLDQPLGGDVYLGRPRSTDPLSGEMLRLFLVVRNDRYGILVKLPGSAVADPSTGRLTATFDNNPRVPFDHLTAKFKGGPRGVLATSQDCGAKPSLSALSPWSGGAEVSQTTPLDVAGDCSFGFVPKLTAGMDSRQGRGTGSFSFRFSREDGERWVNGLTAALPTGLLASVKDVALCSSGQADGGGCPAGSRIGTVDASAGSGTPFVLERKGDVYLTEGYKGCAYGLAVKVPVVAGPFDGSSPETDLGNVVVRQKVCVDPSTAQVTAISDPFPTIWHGIPLRVRSVTVKIDRPGFMLNPSDCDPKQVAALLGSPQGASSSQSVPFQTSGCANLPFKPDLKLSLTGRRQVTTGKHPGVKATVTQTGTSEAGIEKTIVRLPKSLALDPENAQALCEFEDGTKPDLENHCPKGSIVGRVRAKTPLLRDDLAGNVYFVKNVRKDPKTGNLIRTLPMIIVALRGEIAVNLKGESSTTKNGRLVNTFANIPDAPISQFNLNIRGGKAGIIAVTRTRKAKINLCAGRHIAEADMDGHNGRRHDRDIRMKTPCTKKQTKAAKLRAKRAAAKAKRG